MATGTNLSLQFFPASWQGEQRQTPTREYVDFEREGGKVRREMVEADRNFYCLLLISSVWTTCMCKIAGISHLSTRHMSTTGRIKSGVALL